MIGRKLPRSDADDSSGLTEREALYRDGASWAADRRQAARYSARTAWTVAGAAALVAALEAIAIITLTPLKTVEPYALLVDRQTGFVQALKPLARDTIAPDRALTRSLLAQYVIARESFDIDSLREDYRKVSLWSAGEARERYIAGMQSTNPQSPLATLPRRALVQVQINSVSSLNTATSLVRFTTTRTDPSGQPMPPQYYAAVINWRFSTQGLADADRLVNPLGFQVVRYRRNAETPPPEIAVVRPQVGVALSAVGETALSAQVEKPGAVVQSAEKVQALGNQRR